MQANKMKHVINKRNYLLTFIVIPCLAAGLPCEGQEHDTTRTEAHSLAVDTAAAPLVTFIELGSVSCIPCKMMEPVMEAVREEFAGQVRVVFHDVRTPEGKPYAEKYNVRAIPTQVFLDKKGKIYYRHVGYFPKDEVIRILKKRGVK